MASRTIEHVVAAVETSDGAGVKLRRSIGAGGTLDPFLMLDEFGTDNPDDYIAGFPAHPHRGFETVTYMIDGHMRHEDHLGNVGELRSGAVQWMTAGRGIIHSEMPQQESGRMRGFQLWLNLPRAEKMKPASYRDIPADEIPAVTLGDGARVKIIAGTVETSEGPVGGPVNAGGHKVLTDPLYLDVELARDGRLRHATPSTHNALVYVFEGSASIAGTSLTTHCAGILSAGDEVDIHAGREGARFILLAARPIGEPVAQYGPFVMNTREEIEQAIADYRAGRLVA